MWVVDVIDCVSYKRILIVISHSQDFLNGICTNIIHMHQRKLQYYTVSLSVCMSVSLLVSLSVSVCLFTGSLSVCLSASESVCVCQGNYDQYVQTRLELEENQMKKYNWEQDQIAHMKVSMSLLAHCLTDRTNDQPTNPPTIIILITFFHVTI